MKITHQSVRDYITAKRLGDTETANQIANHIATRYATPGTDNTEGIELYHATMCPDPEHCSHT